MICRHCGTEIAQKALICYRCGRATAEATLKPGSPKRRSSSVLVASILVLAILLIVELYLGQTATRDTVRNFGLVAGAVAVIVVAIALRGYGRRG